MKPALLEHIEAKVINSLRDMKVPMHASRIAVHIQERRHAPSNPKAGQKQDYQRHTGPHPFELNRRNHGLYVGRPYAPIDADRACHSDSAFAAHVTISTRVDLLIATHEPGWN